MNTIKQTLVNALALLEELISSIDDPVSTFAWANGEMSLIEQTILELEDLPDEIELLRKEHSLMKNTLTRIAKEYQSPEELRKIDIGLDFEEHIEMAYENIKEEAQYVLNIIAMEGA